MKSCLPRYIKLSKEWDSEILWWHEDASKCYQLLVSLMRKTAVLDIALRNTQ